MSEPTELLEHYTSLSLRKVLADSALVTEPIQAQGHRTTPTEDVEEWLAFDLLSFEGRAARRAQWIGRVRFQVTSFSRMANQRADKEVDAPWILASRVRVLLEKTYKDLPIRMYDESSEDDVGVLQVTESTSTYERLVGDVSAHAVVTTFSATLVQAS